MEITDMYNVTYKVYNLPIRWSPPPGPRREPSASRASVLAVSLTIVIMLLSHTL